MKTPYEFLAAIRAGEMIEWSSFLGVMAKHDVLPSVVCRIFERESHYASKTPIKILDDDGCMKLEQRFLPAITVTDRVSAAQAGNSHQVPVDGNMLVTYRLNWPRPEVAVSWDGHDWQPEPDAGTHLLIIENMQNFLRPDDSFVFANEYCDAKLRGESLLFLYGAGNAVTKACNKNYLSQFKSVYCLFDIDAGGILAYIKLNALLKDFPIPIQFLYPKDCRERLEKSPQELSDKELKFIHDAKQKYPEIAPLLNDMYQTKKKLEQETYLG